MMQSVTNQLQTVTYQ